MGPCSEANSSESLSKHRIKGVAAKFPSELQDSNTEELRSTDTVEFKTEYEEGEEGKTGHRVRRSCKANDVIDLHEATASQ